MPIFRLEGDDISNAELVIAQETDIELESYLEDWLENSPQALAQEPILWIDRQPRASDEDGTIFPDLLGIDSEGNLVIVELKKNRAPRDVVAQLLDYAAWANDLTEQQIHEIAETYFETRDEFKGKAFNDAFREMSEILENDELPSLNQGLRLFIVAEEIPMRIARVCRFLRTSYRVDIVCLTVSTFKTESNEVIVSMETKVGEENIVAFKTQRQDISSTPRWSSDKGARDVIRDAVTELTQNRTNVEFAIKEVTTLIHKTDPNFNKGTVSGQITADCVNHPSRRHHPSAKHNYYWRVGQGKYRLYDPDKDKIEDDGSGNQTDSVTENPT